MKAFIVLFAAVALVSAVPVDEKTKKAEEHNAFLAKIAKECSDETGFELDNAWKLLKGDFSNRSEKAQCFQKCFFTREGFLNEHGEVQTKFIIDSLIDSTKMSREQLAGIISKCSQFKGNDACANAYQLLECYTTDKDVIAHSV